MYSNIQHNNSGRIYIEEEWGHPPSSHSSYSSSPSPSSPSYPPLYPHLYEDEVAYRERELERELERGRERQRQGWEGVERNYNTTPYPPPSPLSSSPHHNNNHHNHHLPTEREETVYETEIERRSPSAPEPWMPPPAKWYQKQSVLRPLGILFFKSLLLIIITFMLTIKKIL